MSSKSTLPGKGIPAAAEPFVFGPPSGDEGSRFAATAAGQPSEAMTPVTDPVAQQKAYEKGLLEGEVRARAGFETNLSDLRAALSDSLREFAAQRESYFQRVESEVVQLALSIARKILRREAQVDPMLLTGIVRVALDSLNEGAHVRLRANPQEVPLWRDYFTPATDVTIRPEVIGDASLEAGSCVLETDIGSTRISMETQLKEIEQGFLDLLAHRPPVRE
jgi:flagellar assembly protein FliH